MRPPLTRPLFDLAIHTVEFGDDHDVRGFLESLRVLSRQGAALSLRVALIAAWLRRHPTGVAELGYPTWTGFVRERVGLGASWLRALIRLVTSDDDDLKNAVANGELPLRDAVRTQHPSSEPMDLDRFHGSDAEQVREARRRARIFLGRPARTADVDAFLVEHWRKQTPPEALLERARQPPSPPTPLPESSWGTGADAPAAELVGPWVEPTSVADAVQQLDAVLAVRRVREAVLARAWALLDDHALWTLDYEDRWELARDVFGWSKRTAQRKARVGWALEWYPELDEAVRNGLDLGAAGLLATAAHDEPSMRRWLRVAERVPRRQLAQTLRDPDRQLLHRYEEAIDLADTLDASAPSAGGPTAVALTITPRPSIPAGVACLPEVVTAARWWVENVKLPKQRGFRKVKERDGFQCRNPECGARTLRVEAHHVQHRQHGGSDDPDVNGLTVCPSCHGRGLHAGPRSAPFIDVQRIELDGRVGFLWTYAGARRILQL